MIVNNKKSSVKNLEADIVVVGGGGGGLVAAAKCAECGGKKILLLEKTDSLGGATVMATGITSVNSEIQVAAGNSEIMMADLFSQIMNESRWSANPDVVRRFVSNTGVFADWVNTKSLGFIKTNPENRSVEWPGGGAFCEMMVEYLKKTNVGVYMETRATKLLTDEKGFVVGVLATGKDTDYKVNAKSVILSTGSFSRNRKMLKKYFPDYFDNDFELEFEGGPALSRFADGDGIKMAQELGSMTDYHMDIAMGTAHHGSENTRNIPSRPELILVNKHGKRFMMEGVRAGGARRWLLQPEAIAFVVFDSDSLEYIVNNAISPFAGMPIQPGYVRERDKVKERLEEENKMGNTKIANTLDDIAKYIDTDPAAFKAEIERFNTFCDKGRDEDFYKDPKYLRPIRKPPYYAMSCNVFWQCTRGGIPINGNMEVMSKTGTGIKGLYATGDQTGGFFSEFGMVSLTGLTWALVSGYMAAESSCEYVRSIS